MKVKNLKGTSEISPKCPSCGPWIRHWKNHIGIESPSCFAVSCDKASIGGDQIEGAHVKKHGSEDMSWYIIPLCESHNRMYGEILEIPDDFAKFLVPVKTSDKCTRRAP